MQVHRRKGGEQYMFLQNFFGRIGKMLGMEEEYDEYEYIEEKEDYEQGKKRGKLISFSSARQIRLTIVEPVVFEEVQKIADELKSRQAVIVNLESTEPGVSKRVIDFMSGLVYGLDANMQKICDGVFLVTPSNIHIAQSSGRGAKGNPVGL
jgi:cell division inhibitor SepF